MSFKTLEQLIADAHSKLRLVPGTSVQVYNEDYTAQLIKAAYYQFAREPQFWWPQFMDWVTLVPDGTTGKPTTDFNPSDKPWQVRHDDIRAIYPINSHRQVSKWSKEFNPYLVTFTRPFFEFISDPYKLLRFLPTTSVETFVAHRRLIPEVMAPSTLVLFDPEVLTSHVAWILATNNGANPSMGVLFLNLFEAAYGSVKSAYSSMPVELDPGANEYPAQWYENPPP